MIKYKSRILPSIDKLDISFRLTKIIDCKTEEYAEILIDKLSRLKNAKFNNILIPEKTNSYAFGIPIALGAKFTLSEHFILGVEIAARCTFSDEIDGSLPDSDELSSLKFGNINNNDWYVFSGFTLTYTFGRNPCFCSY